MAAKILHENYKDRIGEMVRRVRYSLLTDCTLYRKTNRRKRGYSAKNREGVNKRKKPNVNVEIKLIFINAFDFISGV